MAPTSSSHSLRLVLSFGGMLLALAALAAAVWGMYESWSSYWQVGGLIVLVPLVIITIHAGVQGMVSTQREGME